MKSFSLTIIFYLFFILSSNGQYIERHSYFLGADFQFGSSFSFANDNGFCIGGEFIYYHSNGSFTTTSEREFLVKLDSSFNIAWLDTFMLWGDDYPFHEPKFVFGTSDYGITTDIDTDVSITGSAINKDSANGATIFHKFIPTDSSSEIVTITNAIMINDTFFYSGNAHNFLSNSDNPVLISTDINGDTLFYKDLSFLVSFQGWSQIYNDFNNNIYLALQNYQSKYIIIFYIDHSGNVMSSDTINLINQRPSDMFIEGPNRLVLGNDPNNKYLKIIDFNSTLIDSINLGCEFYGFFRGKNNEILTSCLCDSQSSLLPFNYFLDFDSTGRLNYSLRMDSYDKLNSIQSYNDSIEFGTGSMNNGALLFLKLNKPQIAGNLTYSSDEICLNDSILISAPPGFQYKWSSGETTQDIYARRQGIYFAYIEDSSGAGIFTDTVYVRMKNSFSLGDDTIICNSQSLLLSGPSGYSSYLWNDGNTSMTDSASTTLPSDTIFYSLVITDTSGCSSSDTIQVVFDVCSVIPEIKNDLITIRPNPAHSEINIELKDNPGKLNVFELYDIDNKCVLRKVISSSASFNTVGFSRGIYIYYVKDKDEIMTSGRIILN